MKKYFIKSLALCLLLGMSFTCAGCNNSSENIVQDEEELDRYEGITDPESEDDLNDFFPVIDPNDIV